MFKTATIVYKFLHSGSPSYFQKFLSLSSCSYSTRCSHPDRQYLTVPPFRSSVFKSVKHFDYSFVFGAPKIWSELPHGVRSAASVASFRKKLKIYQNLQKPRDRVGNFCIRDSLAYLSPVMMNFVSSVLNFSFTLSIHF